MSVSTMKKLTVLAYAEDADAIVRRLMSLKCVEIRTVPVGEGLLPANTVRIDTQKNEAERRLADIRRALPTLMRYTARKSVLGRRVHRVDRTEFCREGRDVAAWKTVCDTLAAVEHIEALQAQKKQQELLCLALEPWLAYDAPLDGAGSRYTALTLGTFPVGTDMPAVREALADAGAYVETVDEDGHGIYASVTAMRSEQDAIESLLTGYGFLKVALPTVDMTARAAYEAADAKIAQLESELIRAEDVLHDLAEHPDDVEILCDIEATTVNVCVQKRKLAATQSCAVLSGWIPAQAAERVTKTLSAFECACEIAEPEEDEEPPVLLCNNKWAANFEWVVGMYSYPQYGAFDPTFIMSIFYFIIFGLMFADVGYGLLLVAC